MISKFPHSLESFVVNHVPWYWWTHQVDVNNCVKSQILSHDSDKAMGKAGWAGRRVWEFGRVGRRVHEQAGASQLSWQIRVHMSMAAYRLVRMHACISACTHTSAH